MGKLYIVTGACGHLGQTIIKILAARGEKIRGLILPNELPKLYPNVEYIKGDVRSIASLEPLFANIEPAETIFIHTAGLIAICAKASNAMVETNVGGTQNIVQLCLRHKINRLVYVSSVHTIPVTKQSEILKEISNFSANSVVGGYAKTKATATQIVLDGVLKGLDAVVVQPSGILGPYDSAGNHVVQMVSDYLFGRLPAGVNGGYDFVDVRDVAMGCILAAEKGRCGECYILSNRNFSIREILSFAAAANGQKELKMLPLWVARFASPFIQIHAKIHKTRPLYTGYSLYTLGSHGTFSHQKATNELGYCPRDMKETVYDTVSWLKNQTVASENIASKI